MPTVTVTFVKENFFSVTFIHIKNISAVTDPILTKLFGPWFFGPQFFWTHQISGPKRFWSTTLTTRTTTKTWWVITWLQIVSKFSESFLNYHHHNHHQPTENSMSAISQLLLARFWPNFKVRFLETSTTDSNYYGDICPCNICPGNICKYQQYLSCYWPDFDQTSKSAFWEHL